MSINICRFGSSRRAVTFVYATHANVPDYMIKSGVAYRIITDRLGSPRLVIDVATGAVAQRSEYNGFGAVTMNINPGFQPFGFAGGLYDADTALVRFGARDYDAEAARWTAKDPLALGGGDTNLYVYAAGSPVTYADPTGLRTLILYGPFGGSAGLTRSAYETALAQHFLPYTDERSANDIVVAPTSEGFSPGAWRLDGHTWDQVIYFGHGVGDGLLSDSRGGVLSADSFFAWLSGRGHGGIPDLLGPRKIRIEACDAGGGQFGNELRNRYPSSQISGYSRSVRITVRAGGQIQVE
jgi:RHS repeat-associated protein